MILLSEDLLPSFILSIFLLLSCFGSPAIPWMICSYQCLFCTAAWVMSLLHIPSYANPPFINNIPLYIGTLFFSNDLDLITRSKLNGKLTIEKNYMSVPSANWAGTERAWGLPFNLIPSKQRHPQYPWQNGSGKRETVGSVCWGHFAHHSLLASIRKPTLPALVIVHLCVA